MTAYLGAAMALSRTGDYGLDIERLALPCIQGVDTALKVLAQFAQLLDMREQFLADPLLIGFWS
jgi:hypothetical protein